MVEFWLALSFLTTIPTPAFPFVEGGLGRAGKWFPLVGAIVGLVLAGAHWALSFVLPEGVTAVFIITLWAWLTGGLHLDGLADCGDGLLIAASRERRLEIMKDSRVGAFGAISLVLYLMLKGTAVASLPNPTLPLILAPAAARWFLLLAARQPSARPGGMGDSFTASLTPSTLLLAVIVPALLLIAAGWRGLLAAALALAATWLLIRLARHRLGGVTGDVFGLVVEISELAVLLGFIVRT